MAMTTCPEKKGHELAHILVEKQLCACVNVIQGVKSLYFWRGEIVEDSEVILLIKTEARFEENLRSAIIENHPYEIPEFIVFIIGSGSKNYLDWISATLS